MNDEVHEQEQEQELSLTDELSNAFDESVAASDEPIDPENNEEEALAEGAEAEVDEDAVKVDEEEEPVEDEDELTAPENWSKKDQAMFEDLDDVAKEFLNRRHAQMEKALYKKTQELSGAKQSVDSIKQMLDPFRSEFEMSGIDDLGAVRQLVAAHGALKQNPSEAIKWLADSYGINIVMPDAPQLAEVNPEIQALQSQLKELTDGQQQNARSAIDQQLESFESETNEAGEAVHPYFEEVMPDMIGLIKSGQAKDLEDAYEKSLWLNKDVRGKVLAKQKESDAEKSRAKVAKAKKAAGTNPMKSSTPGNANKQGGGNSLRDALSDAYDKSASNNRI